MDDSAQADAATGNALAGFRAAVLADLRLQERLQVFDNVERFTDAALTEAAALGFFVERQDLWKALRPDPAGISRFLATPPTGHPPPPAWLPIHVGSAGYGPYVDWAHFGADGPAEPFFEDSVRRMLRRPINRLVKYRTALAELADIAQSSQSLRPSGLIFHMSRCGSTLVSQMLAQDRRNVVISEAPPLDAIVHGGIDSDERASLLAAMIAALGRRRAPWQHRYFIKLDAWHILHFPLFRKALPDVPWIFLYREPSEVLASQIVQRGIQTMPEYMPASVFGLDPGESASQEDYCALVLRQICRAAVTYYAVGGGLIVNYRELPHAVWTKILPHFGVSSNEEDRVPMARAAQFDAKSPSLTFAGDAVAKRAAATEELTATAAHRLGAVYAELNRLAGGPEGLPASKEPRR